MESRERRIGPAARRGAPGELHKPRRGSWESAASGVRRPEPYPLPQAERGSVRTSQAPPGAHGRAWSRECDGPNPLHSHRLNAATEIVRYMPAYRLRRLASRVGLDKAPPDVPRIRAGRQPGACHVERAARFPGRWVVIALLPCLLCPPGAAAGEPPDVRQAELLHMLRHDCGACHGLLLDGGLGPPLTAEALAGVAPAALAQVILEGRPGTPMPAGKALLSPGEARWLVQAVQAGGTGG